MLKLCSSALRCAGFLAALVLCVAGMSRLNAQTIAAPHAGSGPVQGLHLTVGLVPLTGTIQPGGSTDAGLHFVLEKGWHVYWINAGDSGEAPRIDWKPARGITAGPLLFPTPQRLPYGPLMDYGYENEVLFPFSLHAASGLKAPSTVPLAAHVRWLVCRAVCIPGKADFVLPLKVTRKSAAPNPATAALFARFRARLPQPLPPGSKALFTTTSSGFALAVVGEHQAPSAAQFFPLDQNLIENVAPQPVHAAGDNLLISLKKDANLSSAPAQLRGVLRLSNGDGYEIDAHRGTLPSDLAAALPAMGSTAGPGAGTGAGAGLAAAGLGHTLRYVLLAFLGGIILNLMPCVFPVLFIKGLALVGSSGESRRSLRAHGAVYALGILVSFWAVVAILFALRAGGERLGWGFQFQSPGFLAVIALVLFFFGLSLAGMFDVGLTLTGKGSGLATQGGYAGSFFTGVLAMVVATPCTAPLVGVAIGFALVQPALISFGIFTALALGLAVPYVLLTLNPGWTRLLPRPGAWMEILKQTTAVPVFIVAIWMAWLFALSAGLNALAAGLLPAFLLLAIAGWLLGRWPARRAAALPALAVVAAAVALPLYFVHAFPAPVPVQGAAANANMATVRDNWQPFSDAALQKFRAQGRPVFVDFTASWCLSCQVNQRLVLDRNDVRQRLRDSGVVLMRADWTRHDDAITEALSRLERSGVPVYALYLPGEQPRLLPEVLTPGIVFNALQGIHAPAEQGVAATPSPAGSGIASGHS